MIEMKTYGDRVEAHFKSHGLTLVGQGREFLNRSSQSWHEKAMWGKQLIDATIDGLLLARSLLDAEKRCPGSTSKQLAKDMMRLPIGIDANDLAELDAGEWASAVEAVCSEEDGTTVKKAFLARDPEVFTADGLSGPIVSSSVTSPWESWINKKNVDWMLKKVEDAIRAFKSMEESGLVKPVSIIAANAAIIGRIIGAEPEMSALVAKVYALLQKEGWAYDSIGRVMAAHRNTGETFSTMWMFISESLGYGRALGKRTWEEGAPWTRCQLLHAFLFNRKTSNVHEYFMSPHLVHEKLKEESFGNAFVHLMTDWGGEDRLLARFYKAFKTNEELELSDWRHIQAEVADAARALGSKNVKVLLWGEPGVGKSSLASALAREADKVAIEPTECAVGQGKNEDVGSGMLIGLRAAEKLGMSVGRPLMVLDECEALLTNKERKGEICRYLEIKDSAQIWIANSLKDVHEAYLRRFDFVLKVPSMPLWCRQELAGRLFPGESLATLVNRVAQSMKSPAEIVAARDWCEAAGESSWAVISRRMAGHQYAVGAAREGDAGVFEVVPAGSGGLSLDDFAGSERLKQEILNISAFFSQPARFSKLGAKIPKGYLLTGPPGTGKTLFVRVLSAVSGVPMVVANGAALAEDPSRFALLFSEARKRAPCLVFVDEFDVCSGHAKVMGVMNLERQKILNQLLIELDGFDPLEGVLFLGATHNGDEVDKAVTRSGRLGRSLCFGHPDPLARQEVWRAHLRDLDMGEEFDWAELADVSRGFSCAEIAEASARARLDAAMEGKDQLEMTMLAAACDVVFWGEPGELYQAEEDRWRTAVHEAGHALVAARRGLSTERATLRPRDGFLGAVSVRAREGSLTIDASMAKSHLLVDLAGYAAEKAVFGTASNGAAQDLENARQLLVKCMLDWGVGFEPCVFVGVGSKRELSQRSISAFERGAGKSMAQALSELEAMMEDPAERAALESLAKALLDKRELSKSEIAQCVGAGKVWGASGLIAKAVRSRTAVGAKSSSKTGMSHPENP